MVANQNVCRVRKWGSCGGLGRALTRLWPPFTPIPLCLYVPPGSCVHRSLPSCTPPCTACPPPTPPVSPPPPFPYPRGQEPACVRHAGLQRQTALGHGVVVLLQGQGRHEGMR